MKVKNRNETWKPTTVITNHARFRQCSSKFAADWLTFVLCRHEAGRQRLAQLAQGRTGLAARVRRTRSPFICSHHLQDADQKVTTLRHFIS